MTVSPPGHENYFEELTKLAPADRPRTRKPSASCVPATTPTSFRRWPLGPN